jgi:signal transduction histidine kinase
MIALIDQMLDLSRLEAGRLGLAEESVDLVEIIEQVRQDVAPQAVAKGLNLRITLPVSLPLVVGDPHRLRQILLNLVGNAVKFTEVGSVCVTASTAENGIDIDVSDTGIGITEEAMPHIFEEFRQVDGNMTRRYGGAGLGLAIAHKLAEQMGGSITVVSQHGAGSTFTLHLPAALAKTTSRRS